MVKRINGSKNISDRQNKVFRPQAVGCVPPEGVYFQSRRDTSQKLSSNCDADRTRPLSVNLMQPSGAIARKMLSKGFGNK
jgi:hypothetical protein